MQAYGIDKLKAVLAFPISLAMAYDLAKADGSVDYKDLPLLMGPSMKAIPAFQAATGDAFPQLKDLDAEENAQLQSWLKSEFDIADNVVEQRLEDAFEIMGRLAVFVASFTSAS
jgi:hypothetical protein